MSDKDWELPKNKKDMLLLEKVFAHEMFHEVPFPSKSKQYERLEENLLVWKDSVTFPGRFPVTVEGWRLTPLGHMAYCHWCSENTSPEELV